MLFAPLTCTLTAINLILKISNFLSCLQTKFILRLQNMSHAMSHKSLTLWGNLDFQLVCDQVMHLETEANECQWMPRIYNFWHFVLFMGWKV